MEEKSSVSLEEEMEGWKNHVPGESKGFLTWENNFVFTARIRGYEYEYDAQSMEGCWPTDTLLMSVAACLAIDVLMFLKKMRADINSFEVETSGKRNPTPPQYFKSIELHINVSGSGLTPKKLDRAISLSQEKYCSVYHSLRKDMEVKVSYNINEISN